MQVSINPLYECNMRCDFCYLTTSQLSDKTLMDLDDLDVRLADVADYDDITHVDLYGGEVGLLPEDYADEMFSIIRKHTDVVINIITNFTVMHPMFLRDDVTVSVSFDFEGRKTHKQVLQNILMFDRDISILMLASPVLVDKEEVISLASVFSSINNVTSVEIKPYSSNQSNSLNVTNADYIGFIKKWLRLSHEHKFSFEFINEERIKGSIDGSYRAWSDDHVYIVPSGDFAVLEFDDLNNEFFKVYCTFDQVIEWAENEKLRIESNETCNSCKYVGRCLTEHYRNETSKDNCNGFHNLIKWYEDGRMESTSRNIS